MIFYLRPEVYRELCIDGQDMAEEKLMVEFTCQILIARVL